MQEFGVWAFQISSWFDGTHNFRVGTYGVGRVFGIVTYGVCCDGV